MNHPTEQASDSRTTCSRVEDFVEKVCTKYRITQAVFFGSRARGDHLADSDYDIVLGSPDFQGIFFSRRSALMYDFWTHWPLEVEPLCYPPEEFEKKKHQIGIVSEALGEGIVLWEHDNDQTYTRIR
jgi:uncharacterized protein